MSELAGRLSTVEERIKHMPTNWTMACAIALAVVAVVGSILTVMLFQFGSLQANLQEVGSRIERLDDRIRAAEIDLSAIKANTATAVVELRESRTAEHPSPPSRDDG